MACDSNGYIMIDFAEVDFRRTNQTIDGLFDRCQKVIGTNKVVIVINANNKTPLPSTVCITNGQYVIESVLYTFSISAVDNLHITKKTTPEELIDDDHITLTSTWSSNKINSELDEKQDTLTAGSGISIDDNVISANSGLHIYSTTEHVVGTWIDGSSVYEKTYDYTNPNTGNTSLQHGISNFDKIISVTGSFHRADGYEEPVPYPTNNANFVVSLVDFTSTNMTLVVGSIYSGVYKLTRASFTIRYTKTST